jgi:hypothetical protein
MYYNKEGEKIDMMTCAKFLEDRDYKIIKQDTLDNGKWVSTVWLGLDHQFGDGQPLIFETMVFSSKDDFSEERCKRYSTLKEAIKGHKNIINEINPKYHDHQT